MASKGIKDQVAIVGMGCTPFGERWEAPVDDMLIDAAREASASAGVATDDIDCSGVSDGHPIGASGLRMLFECWLQLRGEAPEDRQIASVTEAGRTLGLTHNLGGAPGECVSFVSIVGSEPG